MTRRRALVSLIVLAGCKTPAQPEPQPPANAPASDDGDRRGGQGNEQQVVSPSPEQNPRPDDLLRRVCFRVAELATDDPNLPTAALEEALDMERCLAEGAKERARDPEGFEQSAACFIEESSMDGARECLMSLYSSAGGPELTPLEVVPAQSAAALRRTCEELLRLAREDSPGSVPDTGVDAFIGECEFDIARILGAEPKAYERALECAKDATASWDFVECVADS